MKRNRVPLSAVFAGSIHNDREGLKGLLSGMKGILSEHSFDAGTLTFGTCGCADRWHHRA